VSIGTGSYELPSGDMRHSDDRLTALAWVVRWHSMVRAYKICRKLENGKIVVLASRNDLEHAKQLVRSFAAHFPGEYVIWDSVSVKDADLEEVQQTGSLRSE